MEDLDANFVDVQDPGHPLTKLQLIQCRRRLFIILSADIFRICFIVLILYAEIAKPLTDTTTDKIYYYMNLAGNVIMLPFNCWTLSIQISYIRQVNKQINSHDSMNSNQLHPSLFQLCYVSDMS